MKHYESKRNSFDRVQILLNMRISVLEGSPLSIRSEKAFIFPRILIVVRALRQVGNNAKECGKPFNWVSKPCSTSKYSC